MIAVSEASWIVGIDASNIRGGGGVTHLVELLRAADPASHGIRKIVVWGNHNTLAALESRSWLTKKYSSWLGSSLFQRVLWQRLILPRQARRSGCHLLFIPGGSDTSGFRPMVTMSQNLLPFEWKELRRYGFSWMTLKWSLLLWTQTRTLRKADGVIFLTRFARDRVLSLTGPLMINWFIAGHEIPDGHWYYDEKEGGRVLGNLSHWSDLTLHLAGIQTAFPCTVFSATPPRLNFRFRSVRNFFQSILCVDYIFRQRCDF